VICTYTSKCPGHGVNDTLADCLTLALDNTRELCSDCTGNLDGFGLSVTLNLCPDAFTLTAKMTGLDYDVVIPADTYCLLVTNESGSVTRLDYDTAGDAQKAFEIYQEQYEAHMGTIDYRDAYITSSTGRIGS
jgi:hypothetical protein